MGLLQKFLDWKDVLSVDKQRLLRFIVKFNALWIVSRRRSRRRRNSAV